MPDLQRTPLNALHHALDAKMVPFAGYEMPVQYPAGVMKEHLHCRAAAGLFDVSHMGQVILRAPGGYPQVAAAMETLVPVDLSGLGAMRQRYGMFTNDAGGILDDLMMANRGDHMFVVVNAACKAEDIAHMRRRLDGVEVEDVIDRALLALQGPSAEAVLAGLVPDVTGMRFMDVGTFPSAFGEVWISRSGYTGEDGFEISVEAHLAEPLAQSLLEHADVGPIGLGARDSLRLEAGLCLYGHDIDTTTTPVEASLAWAIQKVRRAGGDRAGGFPGRRSDPRRIAERCAARGASGCAPRAARRCARAWRSMPRPRAAIRWGTSPRAGLGPASGRRSMGYVPARHGRAGHAASRRAARADANPSRGAAAFRSQTPNSSVDSQSRDTG